MRDQAGLIEADGDTERFAFEANGEDGCYFVPAFTGLGAPYWDSDATGIFTGITRTTGRKELVKAGLESIAYQITDLLCLMGSCTGLEPDQLRVDGGPTANRYLMQFQSDLSGARLRVPEIRELSCLGVAAAAWNHLTGDADSFFSERSFHFYEPEKDALWREKRYAGWQKAIRQVLTK